MRTARPSRISDQRLQRLSLWLALTVAWFAAHVLGRIAPQAAARMLTQHAHGARILLTLRAVRRIGFKARRRGALPIDMRRLTSRGAAGAALRRALRKGTPSARAGALCAVLANAERWIAHIAHRLERGFTKLRCLPKPRRVKLRATASAPLSTLLTIDST
jgi:hypothetical protein